MEWKELLCEQRGRQSGTQKNDKIIELRSEFEKDYHRIIGSASFRRLQDKTQVFPLDQSDFIRTRLTHSLEVSSFAKSLGQNIGEYILCSQKDATFTPKMKGDICDILQCAGLIHDIGNPPFGHFGEIIIREWFQKNLPLISFQGKKITEILTTQMLEDLYHFEGNAQALRLVSKLHYLVDERGMNVTYGLLGTIMKYPVSSVEVNSESGDIKDKKMGYYFADRQVFEEVQKATGTCGKRHPLTFILEAADDIAYKTADIEDSFVKGLLSFHTICEELSKMEQPVDGVKPLDKLLEWKVRGESRGEENPEEYAVKNWIIYLQSHLITCATAGFADHYEEIMEGTWKHDLFYKSPVEELMDLLGDMAYRIVFTSRTIYKMEMVESVILNFLLDKFVRAVILYDVPGEKLSSIDERLVSFISDNYKRSYHYHSEGKTEAEKLYLRLLLGTDYICGMTDSYAKRLYQELTANS